MTHTMTQANPTFVSITVLHIYAGASYDPAARGAIRFIDYSEDRIQLLKPAATSEIASAFIIVQDGMVYTKPVGGGTFLNDTWRTEIMTSLTPADFSPAPGPDFSAGGAPMQFGFQRANSSRFPVTLTHGIDNWRVMIHR